jgi:hypothetical protein
MQLLIDARGRVRCLYGELVDLAALGLLSIKRASHVEADAVGLWWADLALSRGPRLGPFAKRSQALKAETAWLLQHVLAGAPKQSTGIYLPHP